MNKIIQEKDSVIVTAKESCKKCYGRGIIGTNLSSGKRIICNCVQVVQPKKEIKNETNPSI